MTVTKSFSFSLRSQEGVKGNSRLKIKRNPKLELLSLLLVYPNNFFYSSFLVEIRQITLRYFSKNLKSFSKLA